ncbi:FUSC family protein [Radiobacillus deserti]|uniref:Aromatic acid exporter family protein n=1 Tax=Radiobacillus deserti TaxID=2594883 RepID=A0A516KJX2_9BACI|nr:aromatic acid exporter family protein [Radiobacillus deserti]QDP41700.1 aromatic acid exporter family protein [Radiobacillus deserti]
MKRFRFIGGRIGKTGLAVFLTSFICMSLGWPPVFAVITAIVTIEPTVSDSIRKGIIRFPASAIGSAYAVLFIYLFKDSPITYTAAAVLTIITCFKLKLRDGLLVATLTSVAMVEVIHSHFFISFLIRLGTTSIGLVVSTLVNFLVLPPNYTNKIHSNIKELVSETASAIECVVEELILKKNDLDARKRSSFAKVREKLHKTELLSKFQQEESKYHPLDKGGKDLFEAELKQLSTLRLIHYHLGNLMNTPLPGGRWSETELNTIRNAVKALTEELKQPTNFQIREHRNQIKQVMKQFWKASEQGGSDSLEEDTYFSSEIIILYELLSIFSLTESLLKEWEV